LQAEAERGAEALKKFKPAQDTPVVGDTPEAKKLQEGFRRLGEVDSGHPIADAIREHGTTIHFGPLEPGTVAKFDHQTNEITVNEGLKDASPNVLAAHLAHEGTHVQWVKDGKGYNTEDEIVNAEYAAFKNQADVWNEVKGAETDEQCDDVAAIIALGEDEAKDLIRLMYQEEIRQRRE
jgi:hypothetical protein